MTCYKFKYALTAFFEIDSDIAQKLLPAKLHPLERRPGCAILVVSAFDFTESEVGSYGEVVLSIATSPYSIPPDPLPHIGLFPFQLATTTKESQQHGAERWKLPAYTKQLNMIFTEDDSSRSVSIQDGQNTVLRLCVSKTGVNQTKQVNRIYQCFSYSDILHRVNIEICGKLNEHEEEAGSLEFIDHPFCEQIQLLEDDIPFREQSMGLGQQNFAALVLHNIQ